MKMRVLVIVKANKESEASTFSGVGALSPSELIAEMGKFNDELSRNGVLLAADGLYPSSKGKRVRFGGSKPTVIDGPFAETKELIAGYWIWQVKSVEEAVEWIKRAPFAKALGQPVPDDLVPEIEIRPIFDQEDFERAMAEQKAKEAQIAAKR
jgi:hypothetical protein